MKVTLQQAKKLATLVSLNLEVVPLGEWHRGLEVELEHGLQFAPMTQYSSKTNVTDDDLFKTAMIALAHLIEFPDYYTRLSRLEKEAEAYWSKRNKPKVLLD